VTHSSGSATPDEDPPVVPSDPDHAWKALALVNDWVKHAEVKLGVVLAATGVSGGALFNLVKDRSHPSWVLDIAATVCGIAVLLAGVCTMIGLYPVVRIQRKTADDAVNPLFFHDVAQAYKGNAPSYSAVLHTLTTNPNDLVRHLGQQIHATATVAQRKYRWANRAIRALLLDLLALGAVATIIASRNS
jgi:hypothetical protein